MSSVRFELDINGLRELMKSGEMQSALQEVGDAVAGHGSSMSGEAYGTRVHEASYVAICTVFPDSDEARADNYKNNTCLKALSSSGASMSK